MEVILDRGSDFDSGYRDLFDQNKIGDSGLAEEFQSTWSAQGNVHNFYTSRKEGYGPLKINIKYQEPL